MDIKNLNSNPTHSNVTNSGQKQGPTSEGATSAAHSATASTTGGTASTTVEVTNTAKRMLELENRLTDIPEVDMDKVESVKTALREGTLAIDTKRIAQRLLGQERDLKQNTP